MDSTHLINLTFVYLIYLTDKPIDSLTRQTQKNQFQYFIKYFLGKLRQLVDRRDISTFREKLSALET